MKLSVVDEQVVRSFAAEHPEITALVISPDAESAHAEDDFFGDAFTSAMFLDFVKSLSAGLAAAVTITEVIDKTSKLFSWARSKSKSASGTPAPLSERILILVFEEFVNRNAGLREEALRTILGASQADIVGTLDALKERGAIRQTKQGAWKYVRISG